MNKAILLVLSLALALFCSLSAQETGIDLSSLINTDTLVQNDSLTNSIVGFVHANWSQIGVGLSYKHIVLMWNRTVLPLKTNYKPDLTMNYVTSQDPIPDYTVHNEYNTVMIGYMIKLSNNFYPYFGTGTAIRTDMVEVTDPDETPSVYTVKGKEVTFGSGIAGAIVRYNKNIILEGSLQFKPLLPFVGVGIAF